MLLVCSTDDENLFLKVTNEDGGFGNRDWRTLIVILFMSREKDSFFKQSRRK